MSSPPPSETPPPSEENFRPKFTEFFNDPTNLKDADGVTFRVVGRMNQEMERNNVPMSQAHYETAVSSIKNKDPLCTFLTKENSHVLSSTGSGFIYNMGYKFHSGLKYVNTPSSSSGIPPFPK